MVGRQRSVGCHRRLVLSHGWALLGTQPGVAEEPSQLCKSGWVEADRLGTVAAVRRDSNAAAADAAPVRLDAFDWWYRLSFDLPPEQADAADAVLGFDGLATLAEVWLNGSRLFDSRSRVRRAPGNPPSGRVRVWNQGVDQSCRRLENSSSA